MGPTASRISFLPLGTLSLLRLYSRFRGFRQARANVTAVQADIFQFPIAELAESEKICLVLAARDCGGNPAVEDGAEARQKDTNLSPDCWRSS
jgi:hypothetical protein